MYSPSNKAAHSIFVSAVLLGAVLTHRAEAASELNICVDQANPTSAMDLRVARAAAKTQGLSVNLVSFEGFGKGGDGMPLGRFAKMAQADCQLIMGFPVDVSHPQLPPNVQATSAYAGTGFVLIRRGGAASMSLSELPQGSRVGIAQLDTYAGLLFGMHPNIVMHVYPKDSLMLADLEAKHIAAGMAWQPSIERYVNGRRDRAALRVTVMPGEHMLWNLVALYGSQSQDAAKLFDRGLYELHSTGQLQRLIEPYGKPYGQPYGKAAAAGVEPNSPNWGAAHAQHAVAWDTDDGRLLKVADSAAHTKSKHIKAPALYTEDQATKGALAYYKNCAMCHAPLLDGQSAGYSGPALKGPEFADPSYDFHVSDIFNFVAKLMPAATPGSLTHEQDVEIMAFILQQNGYPAGNKELVYEEAEKSKVPIRYYGK